MYNKRPQVCLSLDQSGKQPTPQVTMGAYTLSQLPSYNPPSFPLLSIWHTPSWLILGALYPHPKLIPTPTPTPGLVSGEYPMDAYPLTTPHPSPKLLTAPLALALVWKIFCLLWPKGIPSRCAWIWLKLHCHK